MIINVLTEHEQLISRAIEAGTYPSPEAMIGRALELLRSEDEWLDENASEIRAKIDRAFEEFERGDFFTPEQSREDMARRKVAWAREHHA